ncbi:MAG: hypothetical protein JWN04_6699 [Myxococcaceae bacterium]|nr:hypothetical protein [Myxococcaceae bacterium]
MIDFDHIERKFRSHANLVGFDANFVGIGMALVDAHRRNRVAGTLEVVDAVPFAYDILSMLQLLNRDAIESKRRPLAAPCDRIVAYSLSCVFVHLVRLAGFHDPYVAPETRVSVQRAALLLAEGWSAFLAGDIDDIVENTELAVRADVDW